MTDLITVGEHTFLISITPASTRCDLVEAWKKGEGKVLWGERSAKGVRLWATDGCSVAAKPTGKALSLKAGTCPSAAAAAEAVCMVIDAEMASGDWHDEAEAA
jgi:hypothetical protein